MKTQTISITTRADRDRAFTFLSSLERWAGWAHPFLTRVYRYGDQMKAVTAAGDVYVAVAADSSTGIVDLFVGEHLDEMRLIPIRVVTLPRGSAVTLTFFQPQGMPNEIYNRLYRALTSSLRELMRRLGGGELHGDAEAKQSFFPSLVTAHFFETWDFYTAVLGFSTIAECHSYVHLAHPSGIEFGLHVHEADGLPAELIASTDGRGFWLSLVVADADREYRRLTELGVEIVEALEDKPWGERQFSIKDPNGVVIQIAHRTAYAITADEESVLAV